MSGLDEATPLDHARLFARIIHATANGVVELRAVDVPMKYGAPGVVAGYYDDPELLAVASLELSEQRKAHGVYCTLNPVDPRLLARACNRFVDRQKPTTSDNDVIRQVWLPVDLDPLRPGGVSSTDQEHEAALALAHRIKADLMDDGWPAPILADSGNGAHLLFRLADAGVDPDFVKSVLEGLAQRFNNDVVTVDTGNFNAARIWKVPGTWARKGDDIPAQPHRRARLLAVPATMLPEGEKL